MKDPTLAAFIDAFCKPPAEQTTGHLASDVSDDEEFEAKDDAPSAVKTLREVQRQALNALMGGKGYGMAASEAGVSRRTVYNWAKKDEVFKAALESWRRRMEEHASEELNAAVAVAARVFGHAAMKDWRAAAVLLRHRGLLEGKSKIPADHPLAKLEAMPPAKRAEMEKRIREMIEAPEVKPEQKPEPEYMPELRALQERMIEEEAAACAMPTAAESKNEKAERSA